MAIRTPVTTPGIYFITFTCFQWLPLFELTQSYDLLYTWFKYLNIRKHFVIGYVIMPNHIHLLLRYAGGNQSLNSIIGNAKRLMAYELVRRLKKIDNRFYLAQLKIAVEDKDKSRGKKHEVWENSFDVKKCKTEDFLLQKLNYIHKNPCSKIWSLCSRPEQYKHSSAGFYIDKIPNEFVTHYNLLTTLK